VLGWLFAKLDHSQAVQSSVPWGQDRAKLVKPGGENRASLLRPYIGPVSRRSTKSAPAFRRWRITLNPPSRAARRIYFVALCADKPTEPEDCRGRLKVAATSPPAIAARAPAADVLRFAAGARPASAAAAIIPQADAPRGAPGPTPLTLADGARLSANQRFGTPSPTHRTVLPTWRSDDGSRPGPASAWWPRDTCGW